MKKVFILSILLLSSLYTLGKNINYIDLSIINDNFNKYIGNEVFIPQVFHMDMKLKHPIVIKNSYKKDNYGNYFISKEDKIYNIPQQLNEESIFTIIYVKYKRINDSINECFFVLKNENDTILWDVTTNKKTLFFIPFSYKDSLCKYIINNTFTIDNKYEHLYKCTNIDNSLNATMVSIYSNDTKNINLIYNKISPLSLIKYDSIVLNIKKELLKKQNSDRDRVNQVYPKIIKQSENYIINKEESGKNKYRITKWEKLKSKWVSDKPDNIGFNFIKTNHNKLYLVVYTDYITFDYPELRIGVHNERCKILFLINESIYYNIINPTSDIVKINMGKPIFNPSCTLSELLSDDVINWNRTKEDYILSIYKWGDNVRVSTSITDEEKFSEYNDINKEYYEIKICDFNKLKIK